MPSDPMTAPNASSTPSHPTGAQCPIHAAELASRFDERAPQGVRRVAYLLLGWFSLAAGVIGVVVPVWPTTCFLLLSAWAFGKSSRRMYQWLHRNRWFGRHLRIYRETGRIARGVRNLSLSALWLAIGISSVLTRGTPWIPAVLVTVALAITLHLARLPVVSVPAPGRAEG